MVGLFYLAGELARDPGSGLTRLPGAIENRVMLYMTLAPKG